MKFRVMPPEQPRFSREWVLMEVDVTVIGIPPQPAVGCVRSVWEAARLT
jgi:hypothetical protein